MKILLVASFLILLNVFSQASKASKDPKRKLDTFETQLTIYQNGIEISINDSIKTIEIDRKEFSLRFYNKKYDSKKNQFYSAQIAAFIDKTEFDKIYVGLSTSDLPCFTPGSGMAPDRSGKYESLMFNNNGHHYVIYDDYETKRLNLLEDLGKLLKLEFEIYALYYNDTEVKMLDAQLNEFYLAFFIDKNLDGKIDKGELNKVIIKIK